ncbi:hypothetical protein Tco_0033123 [Tanacetum coccineum]
MGNCRQWCETTCRNGYVIVNGRFYLEHRRPSVINSRVSGQEAANNAVGDVLRPLKREEAVRRDKGKDCSITKLVVCQ